MLKIKMNGIGFGIVELDGVDISDKVSAVTLKTAAGELTVVNLELRPSEVNYEGGVEELTYIGVNGRKLVEEK
jgi:hypothetical protein